MLFPIPVQYPAEVLSFEVGSRVLPSSQLSHQPNGDSLTLASISSSVIPNLASNSDSLSGSVSSADISMISVATLADFFADISDLYH